MTVLRGISGPSYESFATTPTEQREQGERTQGGPFGGLSASEAAKRRHELERARKEAPPPSDAEQVVQALWAKAKRGDVPAAKELREWLRLDLARPPETEQRIEDLTPEQRTRARAAALRMALGEVSPAQD